MKPNRFSMHTQPAKAQKRWVILVFIGIMALFIAIGARLLADRDEPILVGSKPPDFTLIDFSGQILDTSELRGKIVLINFWASWCTPCEDEADLLEQAWQRYNGEGSGEVIFLGVAYMDVETSSLAFLSKYDVTYPNGADLQGKISDLYKVTSVPETYILDPEGILRGVKIGPFASTDEIITAIEDARFEN